MDTWDKLILIVGAVAIPLGKPAGQTPKDLAEHS